MNVSFMNCRSHCSSTLLPGKFFWSPNPFFNIWNFLSIHILERFKKLWASLKILRVKSFKTSILKLLLARKLPNFRMGNCCHFYNGIGKKTLTKERNLWLYHVTTILKMKPRIICPFFRTRVQSFLQDWPLDGDLGCKFSMTKNVIPSQSQMAQQMD